MLTVSTTARHVVGAEVEAEQRSAPECVDQATTRPSEPPGPSPPTKTRPAARAVSATPREWCRGGRTARQRMRGMRSSWRPAVKRQSKRRNEGCCALEVVAMLEAGMLYAANINGLRCDFIFCAAQRSFSTVRQRRAERTPLDRTRNFEGQNLKF